MRHGTERPCEATGEGADAIAVEGPELKRSCRKLEFWYPKENPGEVTNEKVEILSGCNRRICTLQMHIQCDDHQE